MQNNPLSFTDPSGYFLSGLFKKIGRIIGNIARGFMSFAKAIARSTIGRAIIQIAACAFGGPAGCAAASAGLTLAAGGTLKQAFIGAALSFAQVGAYSGIHGVIAGISSTAGAVAAGAAKIAMHAVVGGAVSMAQGGSFETGAFTGAISAGAGLITDGGALGSAGDGTLDGTLARTVVAAAAGGTASVLSGGKFANGAVTGAMAQLFNAEDLFAKKFYHQKAVGTVTKDMEEQGWTILHSESRQPSLGTRVPGGGIRFYDLLAKSPVDGLNYGIEVKTTYGDEWGLRWSQVFKDSQVAKYGAMTTTNIPVQGVGYAGVTIGGMRDAAWSTTVLRNLLLNSGTQTWPQLWVGDGK